MALSSLDRTAAPNAIRAQRLMPDLGRVSFYLFCAAVLVFLVLPSLMIIPISFGSADYLQFPPQSYSVRWYAKYFHDPAWIHATQFSFEIALLVTVAATLIGTLAALALVRGTIIGRSWINALVTAPLILPTIVYAIAVLLFFAPLGLSGTLQGFVLAHSVLAVPYVVLIVSAALYRFDPNLELAALSLGASPLRAVVHVTVPLMFPAVLTSATFAFLASFDDATVSFFLSGLTDVTLPRKMFEDVQFEVSPVLAVVSTLLTLFTLLLIGAVQGWQFIAAARARALFQSVTGADQRSDLHEWIAVQTMSVPDLTGSGGEVRTQPAI